MYLKLVWKMCSFVVVCFSFPFLSKTGAPYVSLTALELSTQNGLSLTQRSTSLCPLSTGTKGVCFCAWQKSVLEGFREH